MPRVRPSLLAPAALLVVLALAASPALAGGPLAEPDELGPFAVGRTTFTAVDATRDGRALPVDVWYPVDPRDATGPLSVYPLLPAGFPPLDLFGVALDEPPVSGAGPFPLVVFSHGSGGVRFQSIFLAETLASHGFVVAAPDHVGNTAFDAFFGTELPFLDMALHRPVDVSFVIDVLLARSADIADPLGGAVDPERIGVAGHSFGAFTTLAVAGGFASPIGSVPADPRVDAIVPIAPVSTIFSDAELAAIDVPMLVVGGTADETTPVDPESVRAFDFVTARPRYRVDIVDAGHASFTSVCDFQDAIATSPLPPPLIAILLAAIEGLAGEACVPGLIPVEEAHRLTELYTVAFLQRHLAGDPRYARYLTPGRVRSRDLPVAFFQRPGGDPPGAHAASALTALRFGVR